MNMGLFNRKNKKEEKNILSQSLSPSEKGDIGEDEVGSTLHSKSNQDYRYIQNYRYKDENGNTHQIDQIEIRKNGIFCIETKNYSGSIYGNENSKYWTQYIYSTKKNFYNPLMQNKSHVACLSRILNYKYKINSIIVFAQNNANNINIANVINKNQLLDYINNFDDSTNYSPDEMQSIMNVLLMNMTSVSNKEHINNIESNDNLINHHICPRCKMGMLVLKTGKFGLFYGCTNYPKCKFIKSFKQ